MALGSGSRIAGGSRLGLCGEHLGPHPRPSALGYANTQSLLSAWGFLVPGTGPIAGWDHLAAERHRLAAVGLGFAPSPYVPGLDRRDKSVYSRRMLLDFPPLWWGHLPRQYDACLVQLCRAQRRLRTGGLPSAHPGVLWSYSRESGLRWGWYFAKPRSAGVRTTYLATYP